METSSKKRKYDGLGLQLPLTVEEIRLSYKQLIDVICSSADSDPAVLKSPLLHSGSASNYYRMPARPMQSALPNPVHTSYPMQHVHPNPNQPVPNYHPIQHVHPNPNQPVPNYHPMQPNYHPMQPAGDADPEAATRPVELIGTLAGVNKAEMMINEVIAENVKPSTFLRNYGQQQGYRPRGPPHDVPLMPCDHLQHLGVPYPSQNQQYPPYGSLHMQRPPMQIPPNNTGGYDYYAANFQSPGPHPTLPSGPPMGHSMPSHAHANYNYAQPPYSQTQAVTQQPAGSSQQGSYPKLVTKGGTEQSLYEPGNQTTSRKMEVPYNKIGVLIGKGGETIRNVQHESGAKIQITRDIDAADREAATIHVQLIGTHASVNKAEMMIKQVIAEDDACVVRGVALPPEALEKMLKQVSNVKVPRYLLVSSGCGIFVLDLAEPNESSTDPIVRFIKKEPNLDLIEQHLPVSAGLLSFGSDAIIFGGHMFDEAVKSPYQEFLYQNMSSIDCPLNIKDYKLLLETHRLKGTSRATYRLTLGEDCKTIHSYECKIMELNKPKFWPTVVEVGSEIHVFDSSPYNYRAIMPDICWNFSHEILRPDGWSEVETTNLDLLNFIDGYLVLDDQIYATARHKCLLFNSVKNKWEEINHQRIAYCYNYYSAVAVKWVWDILLLTGGSAWNVGQVGSGDDRLHVVLLFRDYDDDILVFVYLVSPRDGEVVGIQYIPDFFPVEASMRPCHMVSATVIKAVEDCDGKTMCAVINGIIPDEDPFVVKSQQDSFLFVYTFRLEEISGAVSKAKQSKCRGGEFVRAKVKHRYIFKPTELDRQQFDYHWYDMEGIKACFIDSPM